MICWRCHSNSVNSGSRLPNISDVKTRKKRNVVGIDMIRNNRIKDWSSMIILDKLRWSYSHNKYNFIFLINIVSLFFLCMIYMILADFSYLVSAFGFTAIDFQIIWLSNHLASRVNFTLFLQRVGRIFYHERERGVKWRHTVTTRGKSNINIWLPR